MDKILAFDDIKSNQSFLINCKVSTAETDSSLQLTLYTYIHVMLLYLCLSLSIEVVEAFEYMKIDGSTYRPIQMVAGLDVPTTGCVPRRRRRSHVRASQRPHQGTYIHTYVPT
jgi:hypothetical protein